MRNFYALKKKMEGRRIELIDRQKRINKDLAKPHDKDSKEQAQERENDEVLNQLAAEVDQELRSINSALDRLKKNQYGTCVKCSAEIPMARLDIEPDSPHCVHCAA